MCECAQNVCTKEVYPASSSSPETQAQLERVVTVQLSPSCQRLIMQQGREEQLRPTAGIQGPKAHYPE